MVKGIEVCKKFGNFTALDHLSFQIEDGAVYGLIGPNGAGKSTLLRHIMGIFKPDSGEILYDGEPVFENSRVKERMAFIPDDVFYFRLATLVDMKNYYRGIYPKFNKKVFEELWGCFPQLDRKMPIRRMSKGMQKQAAFMLAISMRPDFLVLDEPVDGLDPVMRRQIWSILMSEVSDKHLTVLVSSHNLRELEDVCDHVGIMNRGKILLEHSMEDLQGSVTKIQVVFEGEMPELGEELELVSRSDLGKVHTLIIRERNEKVTALLSKYHPVFMEVLPLNLEEIFIYELGGENYEVKNIIL